jgi:signal transduction histidine kinase
VEALADSLRLDSAEVWLHSDDRLELAASEPRRRAGPIALSGPEQSIVANAKVSGPAWAKVWLPALLASRPTEAQVRLIPLTHSGQLFGLILVERRRHSERLAAQADVTLEEVAREVALGVNKARADAALAASLDELRASRARVVAAADAERRRIERDLHDGAQQYLVALAVKLRLAQQEAAENPSAVPPALEQLSGDLDQAIEELRTLAHGIYPPLLSSRGLRDAMAAACRRAPLVASVSADGVGRFRPEVESAVYFCCIEALQNAAKHAGTGAQAQIRLWQEDGSLLFEVADDGPGFDPAAAVAGAGLTNMADRLGAVGGALRVESAPGSGCRVRGSIPLAAR